MLEINNLHVDIDGKQIINGLTLTVPAGEVHAIMGPNGSGKSTLSYTLAGRDGYEATDGTATLAGLTCWAWSPKNGQRLALFLAFQYPVEIPGVAGMTFVKTALNAVRTARGEGELSALDFLKLSAHA